MMQTVRKKSTAFGGVQVLYIGDLQLPPVIRDEEWRTLEKLLQRKILFPFARGATTSAIIH
jgi:hypothetical protein